jgi:hypothetical protein
MPSAEENIRDLAVYLVHCDVFGKHYAAVVRWEGFYLAHVRGNLDITFSGEGLK